MIDTERFKLLYGPYRAPKCRVAEKLYCAHRDAEVTVRGMSDARIPWPSVRRKGNHSLILCGDLIRAVERESEMAVAYHWGVRAKTIWKYRVSLGVPRVTNGTRRLCIEYMDEKLTPEARAKGRQAMGSPEVRAKLSASRVGRLPHPRMMAAAREAARRPKSKRFKELLSERSRKMWAHREQHGLPPRREWRAEEVALLGTDTDRAIASALKLPLAAVKYERQRRGIARGRDHWRADEVALIGTVSDAELGRKLGKSGSAVRRKREKLGIPSFRGEWTAQEIALLGTGSDPDVARKLGRETPGVRSKRHHLGIPPFVPRWTNAEIGLLGSDNDKAIAALLGRSEVAVRVRRKKLGIRVHR
jgi:hypothetical protein